MASAEHDERIRPSPFAIGSAFGIRHSQLTMTREKPGCCNVVRLLADYLERQLPPDLRSELEAHLQKCPRCVAQLHTYESTVSLLRSLRDEELPADLRLTVKSFIDAKCHNN
jgi:anti-sigma factor RsiW